MRVPTRSLLILGLLAIAGVASAQSSSLGPVGAAETAERILNDLRAHAASRASQPSNLSIFASERRHLLVLLDTSQIKRHPAYEAYFKEVLSRLQNALADDRQSAVKHFEDKRAHRITLYLYDLEPRPKASVSGDMSPGTLAELQGAISTASPVRSRGHNGRGARKVVLERLYAADPSAQPFVLQLAYMSIDQYPGGPAQSDTGLQVGPANLELYQQRNATVPATNGNRTTNLNVVYWIYGPKEVTGKGVPGWQAAGQTRQPVPAAGGRDRDRNGGFPWIPVLLVLAAVAGAFVLIRPKTIKLGPMSRQVWPTGMIPLAREAAPGGGRPGVRFAQASDDMNNIVGYVRRPIFGAMLVKPEDPFRLLVDSVDTDQHPLQKDQRYVFARGEGDTTSEIEFEIP
jgi:hypothetical protein